MVIPPAVGLRATRSRTTGCSDPTSGRTGTLHPPRSCVERDGGPSASDLVLAIAWRSRWRRRRASGDLASTVEIAPAGPRGYNLTQRGPRHERRTEATRRSAGEDGRLEEVGPVSLRAPVGNGARGLQRGRRRLELLPPRPGALAGLPLGRGRARGDLRRPPGVVLRARALERAGPDSQGASLRSHQQRRQSRRGREGVLLLPRLDAHPLVPEVPLQVPAGGLPLRRSDRDQSQTRATRTGVRASRHRGLRRRPLLRRLRRGRQGCARGPADRDHRLQSRPRGGGTAPAADLVVSQHVVVEGRRRQARPGDRGSAGGPRRPRAPHRSVVPGIARGPFPLLRGRGPVALHGQRDEPRAPVRRAERRSVRQGRHQRPRRPRQSATRSTPR